MGLGLMAFGLGLLHIGWRSINRMPHAAGDHALWERCLARIAHVALMALLVITPWSGILHVMAAGREVEFFGLFVLPTVVGESETWAEITGATHGLGANLLLVTIGLHVAGAPKHHMIDRDTTLIRMLPVGGRVTDAARANSSI